MILVDPKALMGISSEWSRKVLIEILDSMGRFRWSLEVDSSRLRERLDKRVLWYGLKDLEALGIIKKGNTGYRWEIIWLNPKVIRPTYLHRVSLGDVIDTYEQGPKGGRMSKGSVGGATGITPLTPKERKALKAYHRDLRVKTKLMQEAERLARAQRLARLDESQAKPILVKKING